MGANLPKGAECIYDTPEWGAYVRHVGAQNIADDDDISDGFDMFQAGYKAALQRLTVESEGSMNYWLPPLAFAAWSVLMFWLGRLSAERKKG